jgi:NhaA family Na+:H+ antiporter
MTDPISGDGPDTGKIHLSPWEKGFGKILTPFEEFLHRQTTGGLLLMGMAILAMIIANSPLAPFYEKALNTYVTVGVGEWSIKMSVHHWVNDALMAIFFFVVGLELKREFLVGELANLRNATLPIAAAIGGLVVPALLYAAFNPTGDAAAGWGVPMATDIAFAVGAIALLGKRVPPALVTFVVALAIVDDLGAVLVIAMFYTSAIDWLPLGVAFGIFGLLLVLNLVGVRNSIPYFILAVAMWYAMLLSGVHATIAGVLGAMSVPAIPKYDPKKFSAHVRELMSKFDESYQPGKSIMTNVALRTQVQALENSVLRVEAPLQRLEHIWHAPVAFLIIPVFALANAGIPITGDSMGDNLTHPVVLGVSVGLIFGKLIGITLSSFLVLKLGVAQLPTNTRFSQIVGASLLAGIGFTMSIFVSQLAFAESPELLLLAKTGVLFGSLIAGISGYVWLYVAGRDNAT